MQAANARRLTPYLFLAPSLVILGVALLYPVGYMVYASFLDWNPSQRIGEANWVGLRNYLFLLNQTESDIPQVNQSSLDRKAELDAQWNKLKAQAELFTTVDIPGLNRKLWELGVGAVN